jgi:3-isopropylmalate/(R)-2-methylmalate dehydratase small subunit
MGRVVLMLGDDISTDVIYPGRYMATVLPGETPQFAFADMTEFNLKLRAGHVPAGSIIVAGKNFGCGSSREQAVSALRGYDLTIIANDFARIFLQNAVNLGLNLIAAPGFAAAEGDEIVPGEGTVTNVTTGASAAVVALPPARQAIIEAGGLIAYTRNRLLENLKNAKA